MNPVFLKDRIVNIYSKEFLLVILLIALPSLYFVTGMISPIAKDPGIYLTIADGITVGKIPYVDFFTNKTPGFFLIFALIFSLAGDNIFLVKTVNIIVVILGATLSYFVAKQFVKKTSSALLAPIVFLTGSIIYQGYKIQLEQWVILLLLLALYVFFGETSWFAGNQRYFLTGFLVGLGAIFKQYGIVFFGLFFVWIVSRKNTIKNPVNMLNKVGLVFSGCLLPSMLMVGGFYLWAGAEGLRYLIDQTILVNFKNYQSSPVMTMLVTNLNRILAFYPAWLCVLFLPMLGTDFFKDSSRNDSRMIIFFTSFVILSLFPMYKRQYTHYYILTLPVLSILIPYMLDTCLRGNFWDIPSPSFNFQGIIQRVLFYFLVLIIPFMVVLSTLHAYKIMKYTYLNKQLETAETISQNTENDKIIVLGHRAIYYFLTDKWPPSPNLYYAALNTDYYNLNSLYESVESVHLAVVPLNFSCLPHVDRTNRDTYEILSIIHGINQNWKQLGRIQLIGPRFLYLYTKKDSSGSLTPLDPKSRNQLSTCL